MATPRENWVGRTFCRVVGRWPIVFAIAVLTGAAVGAIIVGHSPPAQWGMIAFGYFMVLAYSGLLIMLIVKLMRGTWKQSCDWALEAAFNPVAVVIPAHVDPLVVLAQANPCPQCGQPLGLRKPGPRTFTQRLYGGWTCPDCRADVDIQGRLRPPKVGT